MSTGFVDQESQSAIDELNGGGFPPAIGGISEEMEFDTSDTTEESLNQGGQVELEGNYHFEVKSVEFNLGSTITDEKTGQPKENTPHILVTCTVLQSHKGQSPAGSALWHRIYVGTKDGSPLKKGSKDAMERFAIGVGLMRYANIDGKSVPVNVKTGKPSLKISDFQSATGRQFCAFVKTEKSTDPKYKDRMVIPMGRAYVPNHPDVAHFPMNLEALKSAGYPLPLTPAAAAAKTQVTSGAGTTAAAGNIQSATTVAAATTAAASPAPAAAVTQQVQQSPQAETSGVVGGVSSWGIDDL